MAEKLAKPETSRSRWQLVCCLSYSLTLNVEIIYCSKMSGYFQTTWHYNTEDILFTGIDVRISNPISCKMLVYSEQKNVLLLIFGYFLVIFDFFPKIQGEGGQMPSIFPPLSPVTLKMITCHHIPETCTLHSYRLNNCKSYKKLHCRRP
jgi:hypothetical protein